jgi:hypothetical protein
MLIAVLNGASAAISAEVQQVAATTYGVFRNAGCPDICPVTWGAATTLSPAASSFYRGRLETGSNSLSRGSQREIWQQLIGLLQHGIP